MPKKTYENTLTSHHLLRRIPTAPFGAVKDRHVVWHDEYAADGGYDALRKALAMAPGDVTEAVKASMLRGRGGAGFPTGLKWTFLPENDGGERYLAINADESEPGTFKDRLLLDFDPHAMLEGIAICMYACRLTKAFVFIRGEYHHQAHVLERAIKEAYEHGVFGEGGLMSHANASGETWRADCYVHRGAGAYICGEETGLLEAIEGKRGWPRIKPPFPAVKGLFAKPTIVNNVETLMNVPTILEKGGEWFAELGAAGDGGTRCVAISGHVKLPGVYEVPVGTNLKQIIDEVAGGMRGDAPLLAVIPGGSSTPVLTADEVDTSYGAAMNNDENIAPVEVHPGQLFDAGFRSREGEMIPLRSMPGSGAVVVMEDGTDVVEVCARLMRFYAHESCGQCTPCREGTGWLAKLCSRVADGEGKPGDVELLANVANGISGKTICPLGDAAAWPMLGFLTKFRKDFENRITKS